MRRWTRSITLELSLLFGGLVVAVCATVGVHHYLSLAAMLQDRDVERLEEKLRYVADALKRYSSLEELEGDPSRTYSALAGDSALMMRFEDLSGREIATLVGAFPPEFERVLQARPASRAARRIAEAEVSGRTFRVLVARAPVGDGRVDAVVAIATEATGDVKMLRGFARALLASAVIAAAAAFALAWLIARRAVRHIQKFVTTADAITVDRLDQRLDPAPMPVELGELARAYNDMLGRLEGNFKRLAEFSSDLAHEMRTPVHNLLGQTQVALTRLRSPDEYRQVLESNVEELERLSRMISDMLFLARAESTQLSRRLEEVDLRRELEHLAAFYEAALEEQGLSMEIVGEGAVNADRTMVQRALANLLSNAIHHTPRGTKIRSEISRGGDRVRVSVINPGPGIAAEHVGRVFDRFYRVRSAREGAGDGFGLGLGLAIVKSIMQLHGGTVSVQSVPGALTRFELEFEEPTVRHPARSAPIERDGRYPTRPGSVAVSTDQRG